MVRSEQVHSLSSIRKGGYAGWAAESSLRPCCGRPLEVADGTYCERPMRCAKCGATSQTGKRFCGDCGAPLSIVVRSELGAGSFGNISSVAVTEGIQSERRHLTVLFADLVGSTRLASERDPEDWRDMVTQCLGAIGDEVTGLRGYVARYMGDGVLAYFGWPAASEED